MNKGDGICSRPPPSESLGRTNSGSVVEWISPRRANSVSRGLKALAFGRLCLPDESCDMFAAMDEGNQTIVITAYGTSKEVLGTVDGAFECQRGYAQGCTTSAAIG